MGSDSTEPHAIFTENAVADGSWIGILHMAEAAQAPLSVIVGGALPDTRLYLSVMERGAFDFVAPPFEHESLNFVVRSAALNTNFVAKRWHTRLSRGDLSNKVAKRIVLACCSSMFWGKLSCQFLANTITP